MSLLGCLEVGTLLERQAVDLSDDETQRLERHLSSCEDCRKAAEFLQTFRALSNEVPKLGAQGAERALAAALSSLDRQRSLAVQAPKARSFRRQMLAFGSGTVVAAASLLVIYAIEDPALPSLPDADAAAEASSALPWQEQAPSHSALAPHAVVAQPIGPAAGIARLSLGTLTGPSGVFKAGDSLQIGERYRVSSGPVQLELEGARVTLLAGATVRWLPQLRTLALEQGSAQIELLGSARRPLRLETPSYAALALEGSYVVSPRRIRVARGGVALFSLAGRRIGGLGTGSVWDPRGLPPEARPPRLPETLLAKMRSLKTPPSARELKALHLAASQAKDPALRELLEFQVAAWTLERGERPAAAALYEGLADRAREPATGALSLFAAAFVLRQEAPERSRKLFERYLSRYPAALFGIEARRQLATLKGEG